MASKTHLDSPGATPAYRVLRTDRAAAGCPAPGTLVYPGAGFGCAEDDTCHSGVEHVACSIDPSGLPFFTIPRADIEEIAPSSDGHLLSEPTRGLLESVRLEASEGIFAGALAIRRLDAPDRQTMQPEQLGSLTFSVCQFFADGSYEYVGRSVSAEAAVEIAGCYASSVGARIGTTRRVIVTDAGDCTNWEWRFGEGVVFPPGYILPPERSRSADTHRQ